MPIYPLPQFEADVKAALDEEDRKVYEALKAPKTLVVRFGATKMVGEFPYDGTAKPGCGSKIVVKTHRGTEVGEMLTSTCPNSGCSKSVSRKEMLTYIENSGGRDYPFHQDGKVLRIATKEDLDTQAAIEQSRHGLKMEARSIAERLPGQIRIVDAEPILGRETLTFFYLSEERLDVRDLHRELARHFAPHARRIELKAVGARDEARLTADYERCGQYCCCKNFLKVLKPVSMKSAKVQKATLDPLKISGRCGRLMCCLRYEDQTYEDLRQRLPRKKSRVGTPDGDGLVLDTQILTQLVLVRLDELGPDGKFRDIAVPVEELSAPKDPKGPPAPVMPPPREDGPRSSRTGGGGPGGPNRPAPGPRPDPARTDAPRPESGRPDGPRPDRPKQAAPPRQAGPESGRPPSASPPNAPARPAPGPRQDPRPTGAQRPPSRAEPASTSPRSELDDIMESLDDDSDDLGPPSSGAAGESAGGPGSGGDPSRRRRRRRRRGGPPGSGGPGPSGGSGPSGGQSGPGPM